MDGRRLKKLREEKKLTQDELAEIFGISRVMIASIEQGTRGGSEKVLCTAADYFHVSTDYLLGRTDIPNVYIHEGIKTLDGREVSIYSTQKNLPPNEREQISAEVQRALDNGQAVAFDGGKPNLAELEQYIEQIVRRVLAEKDKQHDGQSKS